MKTTEDLACGNAPRPSALASELARTMSRKCEQELSRVVESVGLEDLNPLRFRSMLSGLRGILAAVGRETLEQFLQAKDVAVSSVEVDGERLRYRGVSAAEWLTPFGRITVQRRTYRADGGGQRTAAPLDDTCGMAGRFMTEDVEELAMLGMAMVTAPEVAQILAKALPERPSSH